MNSGYFLLPTYSLMGRDTLRFFRQKSRLIGAIGTPLLFWFLIGSGVGSAFQSTQLNLEMNYLEYLFPGTAALVLLMTSVFSTISVIQDRQGGFLQSVIVAPVRPSAVVSGKVLGGVSVALFQGILLLAISPLVGFAFNLQTVLFTLLSVCVFSFSLTAFAFCFAWRVNSVQGFHGVMNLVLFPMWMLSGALFPLEVAPPWLQILGKLNPLSYGVSAFRQGLYANDAPLSLGEPKLWVSLAILGFFGFLFSFIGSYLVAKRD